MIQSLNLTKRFGGITAVDDLSLDLKPGETLGLLGPNGAGKSTLVSMLCGLTSPDSGTIEFDQTCGMSPDRIGLAPQDISLYEELSAEENLRFFGKLYQISGKKLAARVDNALEFAGLTARRKGRVGTFSGGMKRRLNIACAMVHDPKLLLLDEPTVGVDPQSRLHIFECIEQLQSHGLTILLTTHYMEEAERLCDRIAIIDEGRLLRCGPLSQLVAENGNGSRIEAELVDTAKAVGLPGRIHDNRWIAETHQPIPLLADAHHRGIQFRSIQIGHASLETIFLNLTGKSLRD